MIHINISIILQSLKYCHNSKNKYLQWLLECPADVTARDLYLNYPASCATHPHQVYSSIMGSPIMYTYQKNRRRAWLVITFQVTEHTRNLQTSVQVIINILFIIRIFHFILYSPGTIELSIHTPPSLTLPVLIRSPRVNTTCFSSVADTNNPIFI